MDDKDFSSIAEELMADLQLLQQRWNRFHEDSSERFPSECKRSTEVLTHYLCPACDQWWTIGDSPYNPGDKIYCPNGHPSIISEHDSRNDKLEPMT